MKRDLRNGGGNLRKKRGECRGRKEGRGAGTYETKHVVWEARMIQFGTVWW